MVKKIFKFLLLILTLSLGLQLAALAVGDTTPMKLVVNAASNQTLYVVNNDVSNNHANPAIISYPYPWSTGNSSSMSLPAGTRCHGMAVLNANTLYIGVDNPYPTQDEIRVYTLDGQGKPTTSTNMTGATWSGYAQVAGMAVGGDNKLFVADKYGGKIKVFDTTTNAFVKDIADLQGKSGLNDIAVTSTSATNYKIYVSRNTAPGAIYVFTYDNGTITLTNTISDSVTRATTLKVVGNKLFAAVNGSDGVDIKVYDTSDDHPIGNVKSGIVGFYGWTSFDVSSDGSWLIFKKAKDSGEAATGLYRKLVVDIDITGDVPAEEATPGQINNQTPIQSDGIAIAADSKITAMGYSFTGNLLPIDTTNWVGPSQLLPPSELKQFDLHDQEITPEGSTPDNRIKVSFTITPDRDKLTVTPVVAFRKVLPEGQPEPPFTEVTLSPVDTSGGPVNASTLIPVIGTFENGNYEWRVKITNADQGLESMWVDYNGTTYKTDFTIGSPFTIVKTSPADGATGVALNVPIVIDFNQKVNKSTFVPSISPSVNITGTYWSEDDTRVALMHDNFATSKTYTVTVEAKNTTGDNLSGDKDFSFTTSSNPNDLAPYIIQTSPSNGATAVYTDAQVVITFAQPITANSFQYKSTPDPSGWNVSWSGNGTVATLTHTAFSATTNYSFEVTAAKGTNGFDLVQGPVPNPFYFTTGAGGQPIVNINIKRDSDTTGGSITATWSTNPAGLGVDIYTLTCTYDAGSDNYTSFYTTDPSKWTKAEDNVTIGTKTFQNKVGLGTAEYYKLIPHGATLASSDLKKDVVGKFDIAVGSSDTMPNRFFVSVPLVPIAPKTSSLADIFGAQPSDGDSVLIFNMSKDVTSGSTITGGTWAAFPGVPAVSSIERGRCYGYLTQTSKFITVLGSLPTTPNSVTLTGGWDQTNDRPAISEWIANAFPTAVRIQDSGLGDVISKGTSPLDSGTVYQFTSNADLIDSNDSGIAYDSSSTGWVNGSGQASTLKLFSQKGFMFTEPKLQNLTWTQPVPY